MAISPVYLDGRMPILPIYIRIHPGFPVNSNQHSFVSILFAFAMMTLHAGCSSDDDECRPDRASLADADLALVDSVRGRAFDLDAYSVEGSPLTQAVKGQSGRSASVSFYEDGKFYAFSGINATSGEPIQGLEPHVGKYFAQNSTLQFCGSVRSTQLTHPDAVLVTQDQVFRRVLLGRPQIRVQGQRVILSVSGPNGLASTLEFVPMVKVEGS